MKNKTYFLLKQPGLDLITASNHDSMRLRAYLCPSKKLTIGFGHVILPKFDFVMFKGMNIATLKRIVDECQKSGKITKECASTLFINPTQAAALLKGDTKQLVNYLNSVIHSDINQNQFDALCSLVFNWGQGNFAKSDMRQAINNGDFKAAAAEFDKIINGSVTHIIAGKKVIKKEKLPGLITRRAAERRLFETPSL